MVRNTATSTRFICIFIFFVATPTLFSQDRTNRLEKSQFNFQVGVRNSLENVLNILIIQVPVHEVVVEFEYSTLWPKDNEGAIKAYQSGFFLEMAKRIQKEFSLETHVSTERQKSTGLLVKTQTNDVGALPFDFPFLDIVYPTHVFRVRIFYPHIPSCIANTQFITFEAVLKAREVGAIFEHDPIKFGKYYSWNEGGMMLCGGDEESTNTSISPRKRADDNDNVTDDLTKVPATPQSIYDLKNLWWRCRVRTGFHALATEFPAFAPTTKLCARWLECQGLLESFEDMVEHLVALLFSRRQNLFGSIPTSCNVGLARFLCLLKNWEGDKPYILLDSFFGTSSGDDEEDNVKDATGSEFKTNVLHDSLLLRDQALINDATSGGSGTISNNISSSSLSQQKHPALTRQQVIQIQQSFERRRKKCSSDASDSEPLYLICSRFDPHGVFVRVPSFTKMQLLKLQAAEGLKQFSRCLGDEKFGLAAVPQNKSTQASFSKLFDPIEFDVTFVLKPKENYYSAGSRSAKRLKRDRMAQLTTNLSPAQLRDSFDLAKKKFVSALERYYAELALVFYCSSKNQVSLKWRPLSLFPQSTKSLMSASCSYVFSERTNARTTEDGSDSEDSDDDDVKACNKNELTICPDIVGMMQTVRALAEGIDLEIMTL